MTQEELNTFILVNENNTKIINTFSLSEIGINLNTQDLNLIETLDLSYPPEVLRNRITGEIVKEFNNLSVALVDVGRV